MLCASNQNSSWNIPMPMTNEHSSCQLCEVRFLRVEAVVTGARNGNSFDSRLTDHIKFECFSSK